MPGGMPINPIKPEAVKMKRSIIQSRSGLSLFEILASLFVLMVGLLGVLAVLPFGLYQMNRVNKADLGGNCGRAAIQEIQVRGWAGNFGDSLYDPFYNANPPAGNIFIAQLDNIRNEFNVYTANGLCCDRPLIVDPLLIFSNINPSPDITVEQKFHLRNLPAIISIPRIICVLSSKPDSTTNANENNPNHADYRTATMKWWQGQVFDAFYWKDDRNFAAPESALVQVPRPVGVVGSDKNIQSHENYSWLYMLTPQVRGNLTGGYAPEENIVGYDVDVVVFFERNTDLGTLAETERFVSAVRDGATGYRGGSFIISAGTAEELDLTNTRWLLLSGINNDNTMFAKWYRIVSVGDIEQPVPPSGNYTRRLMLLGPTVDPSVSISGVTLAKGVIHVYSTVIKK